MAKVTITFEDQGEDLSIKTHFDPKPSTNSREHTDAQDAAFQVLEFLKEKSKEVLSVKVNGNPL